MTVKIKLLIISLFSIIITSCNTTKLNINHSNKKEIVEKFYNTWDSGSREDFEDVISKQLIDHDQNPMDTKNSFDATWDLLQALGGLEMKHTIKQMHYLQDGRIMVRWTASAKHVGTFFGMPASNKTAYYTGHDILKVNEGKVVEMWHVEQIFQLMQQLK